MDRRTKGRERVKKKIRLTADKLRCLPRRVDVGAWARQSGRQDPVLLDNVSPLLKGYTLGLS